MKNLPKGKKTPNFVAQNDSPCFKMIHHVSKQWRVICCRNILSILCKTKKEPIHLGMSTSNLNTTNVVSKGSWCHFRMRKWECGVCVCVCVYLCMRERHLEWGPFWEPFFQIFISLLAYINYRKQRTSLWHFHTCI
jgi:hypothetical protein